MGRRAGKDVNDTLLRLSKDPYDHFRAPLLEKIYVESF
jgi:hypothetical protein